MSDSSKRQPPVNMGVLLEKTGQLLSLLGAGLMGGSIIYLGYLIIAWLKHGVWISFSMNDWLTRDTSAGISLTDWVGFDEIISFLLNGHMGIALLVFGFLLLLIGLAVSMLSVVFEGGD